MTSKRDKIKNGYCEIVIRYTKDMPPTTLDYLQRRLMRMGTDFTPQFEVKIKLVKK